MSDLKHQSINQLQNSKQACEANIKQLSSNLNGQRTRLEWVNKYLFEKTPVELSIEEIEAILGHKLIIK